VFEAQVEELLRSSGSSPLDRVRALVPGFRGNVITAVQQLLGMVMKMDAEPTPTAPADLAGPFYRAAISLALDDQFDVTLALLCNRESANAFSMAMTETEAPSDALYEMVNIVGGRLRNAMTSRGLAVTQELPVVEELAVLPSAPPSPDDLLLDFGVVGQPLFLSALVTVTSREALAAKAS